MSKHWTFKYAKRFDLPPFFKRTNQFRFFDVLELNVSIQIFFADGRVLAQVAIERFDRAVNQFVTSPMPACGKLFVAATTFVRPFACVAARVSFHIRGGHCAKVTLIALERLFGTVPSFMTAELGRLTKSL